MRENKNAQKTENAGYNNPYLEKYGKNKRGGKLLNLIKRKKFLESKNVIYRKVK